MIRHHNTQVAPSSRPHWFRRSRLRNGITFLLAIFFAANHSALAAAGEGFELPAYAFEGHFSRAGHNQSPSQTVNNNIYIKLFPDRWIAMMYVELPYARDVSAAQVTRAMSQARSKTKSTAYLRGKFDSLEQPATVHLERYGHLEDRIVFECGSLAPCTIRFSDEQSDDYLELIKPGVINQHIIKYDHVSGE